MSTPPEMNWYIGTMGFSYQDWNGVFYPNDMPAHQYLNYYSRVFNAVEIDSTFYGTPRGESVKRWLSATPVDFKFAVKAPRIITHEMGLVGALGLTEEFISTVSILGSKLGAILFQFPPSFSADRIDVLGIFMESLPAGLPYAIEVRDRSWYNVQNRLVPLLEKHHVCWAATQYPGLPAKILLTTDFIYVRWIGQHGTYRTHDHERVDLSVEMVQWLNQIRSYDTKVGNFFGYFNNDYAGFAAGSALRFKEVAGLPRSDVALPRQATLF